MEKLPRIELIPVPEGVNVPENIPALEVRIPSTYAEYGVEYEDGQGKSDEATR